MPTAFLRGFIMVVIIPNLHCSSVMNISSDNNCQKPWLLPNDKYIEFINDSLKIHDPDCIAKFSGALGGKPNYLIYNRRYGLSRYWQFKLQGLGFSQGLDFVAERIWDSYMLKHIDFNETDVIYDIGANVGDLHLAFQLRGLRPVYIGLEPGLREYEALHANISGCRMSTAINVAIGPDDNNSVKFYVSSESGDSSLIEPAHYSEIVDVPVRTLSSLHNSLFGLTQHIKLIKLEAEGYEPEICHGLLDLLPQVQYISADLGWERGILSETTAPSVINTLLSHEFSLEAINKNRLVCLFKNRALRSI